jgi:NAD(P) transhydrogenase subunit alpha
VRLLALAETLSGERRVALVPETAARLDSVGLEVLVETDAGRAAFFTDEEYVAAGARLIHDRAAALADVDLVISVDPVPASEAALLRPRTITISMLAPATYPEQIEALAERGATCFALELVPRTTRAQSMDALSSQSLVGGYRAALAAAWLLPKFFPMFMTAAGTVKPAQVLVLGTGVAGLQAIATARRLGAHVTAYDVRPTAADEVRSLGATFLSLELESQEGVGGYARAQSPDFLRRQREVLAEHLIGMDVVITTAAVPGRPAPLLLTADMVAGMAPGSVIVDLAADSGGNCELTRPGERIEHSGVTVYGMSQPASDLARHASELLARNVAAFVDLLVSDGAVTPDWSDEIVTACCVVRDGQILMSGGPT